MGYSMGNVVFALFLLLAAAPFIVWGGFNALVATALVMVVGHAFFNRLK
ncbi:hypothetical protein [Rhizobium sp. 18065]|nr:hypothetical protein [Rhizobium sp. 18065]